LSQALDLEDLTSGGLPSDKQLRVYWGWVCDYDKCVVEELVYEWG
jgi:hypothetical protein